MAGGYGAGSAANSKWIINTVYAPTTVTRAETFVWYQATPQIQLGVAYLWKQSAFRALASVQFLSETPSRPSISASMGVQGIGTGNPGYSVTAEKNWQVPEGTFNMFAGIGLRSNERHGHPLGGAKFTTKDGITLGYQHDGHDGHPFLTYGRGIYFGGVYLIAGQRPALMFGVRF